MRWNNLGQHFCYLFLLAFCTWQEEELRHLNKQFNYILSILMAFPFCFRLLVLVYLLIHSLSLLNPYFSVSEYCIYYFGIVRIDRKKWEIIFSALRF